MKKINYLTFIFFFSLLSSAGQIIIKNHEVIEVKGGWFEMGGKLDPLGNKQKESFPVHKVYVDNFYIGTSEITNRQYCIFLNTLKITLEEAKKRIRLEDRYCYVKHSGEKYVAIKGYEDFPVNSLSWDAANEYCLYFGGRLPTEAEWEFAAKGGTKSKGFIYSGSNNIDEVGVTSDNVRSLCRVKSLLPNELGIYDMSGNIREYCGDWYDPNYYEYSPSKNPKGPKEPVKYVLGYPLRTSRGGSFNVPHNLAIPENRCPAESRKKTGGGWENGFRICFDK